jgi:glycosyltransferase involved in cell wall biosynthesis
LSKFARVNFSLKGPVVKQNTKTDKKRLLVISPWESPWSMGGEAGVSDDYYFIRGFARAGFEIHFLVPEDPENSSLPFEGVRTHTYPNFFRQTMRHPITVKRLLWPWLFNRNVIPRALSVARSIRPHFILGHSHYTTKTTQRCREELGVPAGVKLFGVMDLVHTEWPRWKYYLKNFEQISALRFPQDAWIVLDDGTKGDRVLAARGVPAEKIHFLPNGLNLEWQDAEQDRIEARKKFGLDQEAAVVLYLARFVASKRPQEVIRSIPRVLKNVKRDVLFVFAGDGPERSNCEDLAKKLGIAAVTDFVGTVPHKEVPQIMSASDFFVTTSSLTNMSIPTCEAFICGLPVVAYDIGDTNKVVIPSETGILVPDADRPRLADAIISMINNEDERCRLGENARNFARENFTGWDERIQMELDIINGLID